MSQAVAAKVTHVMCSCQVVVVVEGGYFGEYVCKHHLIVSIAQEFFRNTNFWMSFFHLWALTLNGQATFLAPGLFDGYTLLTAVPVAGPSVILSASAAGYGVDNAPWSVLAMVYQPNAEYHGSFLSCRIMSCLRVRSF